MINEAQAVAIRSPEGLLFRLYPAGLYRRFWLSWWIFFCWRCS